MLQQSLPINSIIGNLAEFCAGLRMGMGDLDQVALPPSIVVADLVKAIGLPDQALGMILSPVEMVELGEPEEENTLKCQVCGEEALHLVRVRGCWRLLCDTCEHTSKH